jgi:predicted O-methyltransferase YrrM
MKGASLNAYWQEARRTAEVCPGSVKGLDLLLSYRRWRRSLIDGANALTDGQPWMTFGAIRFLKRHVHEQMRIFEYGTGGSTLFWARAAREVISIEHDRAWSERVQRALQEKRLHNCQLRLIEAVAETEAVDRSPADPEGYVSADAAFRGFSFRAYAESIKDYPNGTFDLVAIDGRARPSCCRHAIDKVKRGGFLLLDNAERDYYGAIHQTLGKLRWQKFSFLGPGPYNPYFWQTCIWLNAGEGA